VFLNAVLMLAMVMSGEATFVAKPCDPALAAPRVTCGSVLVPENRAAPAGRAIALNVAIVRPPKSTPGAIPMFHLEGGPGIAATPIAPFYLGPGAIYA
jgi:hypothetical protein